MKQNNEPTPNPNLHPIVVGIDFDQQGINALKHAIGMATMGLMEIHVLHAVEPRPEIDLSDRHMQVRFDELTRFVKPHVPANLTERLRLHLTVGKPAETLTQLAVDVDAELVVVGTHDRGGVAKLVQGSVAAKLLETAPCPVLVAVPQRSDVADKAPIRYGAQPDRSGAEPYRISARGAAALA